MLTVAFLCLAGFLAAAVDAIAGGGGLISLPALLLAGIPPHFALGTNKFAATTGTFNSAMVYARSKKTYMPLLKYQMPCTLAGTALGVWTVLQINSDFLNKIVLFLILFVGIYTIMHKNLGMENRFTKLTSINTITGCLFAFALGFYDGFFGPGTGSFLIFLFIAVYRFDFVVASANAKVLNFISNITSLVLFAFSGNILYHYAVPMALFMVLGSHVGTKLALKKGAKLVKPIFVTMSLLVAIKLIIQWV